MLPVSEVRDRADLLASRVVDPDLSAHVALRVDVDPADVADLREDRLELCSVVETLVGDRDEQPRRHERGDEAGQSRRSAPARVVGASPLSTVQPLVGDAVALGRVPADDGLPDVVVGEVGVLVVRRVDVDEIDVELGRELVRVEPRDGAGGARHDLRQAQLERAVGPRRPRLQVGHLQAGRAVDAVGGLDERRQQHPSLERRELVAVDRIADRIDPPAVVRLQVPRLVAEGLGHVAVPSRERRQLADDRGQPGALEGAVCGDVGLPEGLRVGGEVVRVDGEPERAHGLADPGRPCEEITGRAHRKLLDDDADQRDESPFGADVLDHRGICRANRGPSLPRCRDGGLRCCL